jgi:hypothetical protein
MAAIGNEKRGSQWPKTIPVRYAVARTVWRNERNPREDERELVENPAVAVDRPPTAT